MAGPVTVTCPVCEVAFPVPTEVLAAEGAMVIVRMDRSEVYGHMRECAAEQHAHAQGEPHPDPEAEARRRHPAGTALPSKDHLPAFVATGRRPCLVCRVDAPECMARLGRSAKGCCPACEDGNTHPAKAETWQCATWGAEQDADQ